MYIILSADAPSLNQATAKLANDVNKLIKEGWSLQGGVSVTNEETYEHYFVFQAMIKNEK